MTDGGGGDALLPQTMKSGWRPSDAQVKKLQGAMKTSIVLIFHKMRLFTSPLPHHHFVLQPNIWNFGVAFAATAVNDAVTTHHKGSNLYAVLGSIFKYTFPYQIKHLFKNYVS